MAQYVQPSQLYLRKPFRNANTGLSGIKYAQPRQVNLRKPFKRATGLGNVGLVGAGVGVGVLPLVFLAGKGISYYKWWKGISENDIARIHDGQKWFMGTDLVVGVLSMLTVSAAVAGGMSRVNH